MSEASRHLEGDLWLSHICFLCSLFPLFPSFLLHISYLLAYARHKSMTTNMFFGVCLRIIFAKECINHVCVWQHLVSWMEERFPFIFGNSLLTFHSLHNDLLTSSGHRRWMEICQQPLSNLATLQFTPFQPHSCNPTRGIHIHSSPHNVQNTFIPFRLGK